MLDFEQSILIDAAADEVFGFVSNLNNLPKYLPALQNRSGVNLQDDPSQGQFSNCEGGGYFRVQPTEYIMEWCAEAGQHCTGWLEVEDLDDGCEVTVHLSFHPNPMLAARMRPNLETIDAEMEAELTSVMSTIKQLCENAGRPNTALPTW